MIQISIRFIVIRKKIRFNIVIASDFVFICQNTVTVACHFHHRIAHVSECYRGSVHDITIIRESGLLEHVNDSVQIIADKEDSGEDYAVTPRLLEKTIWT